jgi:hypothetical protein
VELLKLGNGGKTGRERGKKGSRNRVNARWSTTRRSGRTIKMWRTTREPDRFIKMKGILPGTSSQQRPLRLILHIIGAWSAMPTRQSVSSQIAEARIQE